MGYRTAARDEERVLAELAAAAERDREEAARRATQRTRRVMTAWAAGGLALVVGIAAESLLLPSRGHWAYRDRDTTKALIGNASKVVAEAEFQRMWREDLDLPQAWDDAE